MTFTLAGVYNQNTNNNYPQFYFVLAFLASGDSVIAQGDYVNFCSYASSPPCANGYFASTPNIGGLAPSYLPGTSYLGSTITVTPDGSTFTVTSDSSPSTSGSSPSSSYSDVTVTYERLYNSGDANDPVLATGTTYSLLLWTHYIDDA